MAPGLSNSTALKLMKITFDKPEAFLKLLIDDAFKNQGPFQISCGDVGFSINDLRLLSYNYNIFGGTWPQSRPRARKIVTITDQTRTWRLPVTAFVADASIETHEHATGVFMAAPLATCMVKIAYGDLKFEFVGVLDET